jgi:hypothetical protein
MSGSARYRPADIFLTDPIVATEQLGPLALKGASLSR